MNTMIQEGTLSDGSKVYAVQVTNFNVEEEVGTILINCVDKKAARALQDVLDTAFSEYSID